MALQFVTTADAVTNTGVKVCIYGMSGLGKTVLAATTPGPTLILSAEKGLLSLTQQNIERVYGAGRADIQYNMNTITIDSMATLKDAYAYCRDHAKTTGYKTLYLDSVTEMAEQVLRAAKLVAKDPRQAYGTLIEEMMDLMKQFRDLGDQGMNTVLVFKQEHAKDEVTGITSYVPMMPGAKLSQQVPYLFDLMLCLRIGVNEEKQPVRYLQTQPDLQYGAKDRSGLLAPAETAHLGYIFAKTKGITQ